MPSRLDSSLFSVEGFFDRALATHSKDPQAELELEDAFRDTTAETCFPDTGSVSVSFFVPIDDGRDGDTVTATGVGGIDGVAGIDGGIVVATRLMWW